MSFGKWTKRPEIGERTVKCDGCGKESQPTGQGRLPFKWFAISAWGEDESTHACRNACVQAAADLQTHRMEAPILDEDEMK